MGGGKCEKVPVTEEERAAMIAEIAESAREVAADYNYMTLHEIADIIGVSSSQNVRRMVEKFGLTVKKRYTDGKIANVVTIEDGRRFIKERVK